jgi:Na+-translocating ferredoxin:NAD+ oxidoreductase subunit D
MSDQQFIISASPHVHSGQNITSVMRDVILALLPALLVGIWFFGFDAFRVLILAVAGCVGFEMGMNRLLGRASTIKDLSAALTGILLAMNLPSGSPWWMVIVGSGAAIVLGKAIYGGLGYNPFNPALVARVFLLISFPVQMTRWVVPNGITTGIDAATGATPLGAAKEAASLGNPLSSAGIPDSLQLLIGNVGGSFGEVSALALLVGGAFLLYRGIIRWQIPVGFIGSVVVITGIAHLAEPERYLNPLFHVLAGGLIIGAFFMATDMVTSPVTRKGMLIFGIGCGVLTSVIRLWGGYPEGVSFAILLMNAVTPLIDRYTRPKVFGQVSRKLYEEASS